MVNRSVHVLDDLQELDRFDASPEHVNTARRSAQHNVVGRRIQTSVLKSFVDKNTFVKNFARHSHRFAWF